MDSADLLQRVFMVIALLLSLTVHEWAHAATAVHLGDDTPIRQGRFTLNPLAHIDPIGTILLPLIGVPFGWAKPVEWNPSRIRRDVPMKRALWMVSIAGPASNIAIALLAAIGLILSPMLGSQPALVQILRVFFGMNVGLAVFNMLPVPPLDGSRIVDATVPRGLSEMWATVHRFAPFILFGILLIPGIRDGIGVLVELVANGVLRIALTLTGN